jgi:membrane-bound serine protease (ClpP class)
MRRFCILLLTLGLLAAFFGQAHAQSDRPLAILLDADGPIMPAMQEYIERGIQAAEREGAEVLIIQLDTPGGDLLTTIEIIQSMRASSVPVVVFVGPNGAIAGSAGALITMGGHASAMAPETAIGASSPISGSGEQLDTTSETKAKEISKAAIRPLVEPRGRQAVQLAEAMIDVAKAVTAEEALDAGLIDFISRDTSELLEKLDGFTVQMADGPRTLDTANARSESLPISFIEQLILMLTDPNIVFLLVTIGAQAILIEISSPGGWVAGFVGVVCLALAGYGLGILPVNWFGLIFLVTAFVLFILDIKAPTHGALTTAGVASFIVGALVLFNSPGTPQFQRVSIPLVVGAGIVTGLVFLIIVGFGLRAMRVPIRVGEESLVGKTGTARSLIDETGGQVQLMSELWSAELAGGAAKVHKGDAVEVVEVKGLRLIIRKK